MIGKITRHIVHFIHQLFSFKIHKDKNINWSFDDDIAMKSAPLALTIVIEYLILFCMALLFVNNVQSFMRKLLFTLKNILRDNNI